MSAGAQADTGGVPAGTVGRAVSVLPDVAGLDRTFDYLVPEQLDGRVRVGSLVRVELAGRRVGGWVVAELPRDGDGRATKRLRRVSGWGPEPDVVDLSRWASWRYAGRRNAILATASPGRAVTALPPPDRRRPAPPVTSPELAAAVAAALARPPATTAGGDGPAAVLRLPPALDPTAVVALVAQRGPTLVVLPSSVEAGRLARRLRGGGAGVAEVPEQWAQARAGAGVVVGARAAAWAPCPGLAAVVVLDAHEEALVQEQAPTWWATTVGQERARRAGVPCVLVTACPTLDLLVSAPQVALPPERERQGWAP
ncbi:MAG TPA: hypothetical protein VKV25_06675, partial [Acidimicrobiales bacterium]|nr:hypothetical protein [Acidimicrobiales bacterium]